MNRAQMLNVETQHANLEDYTFKFKPATVQSRGNLIPVQLDLGSFIREIKKNSIDFIQLSKEGAALSQMFSINVGQVTPALNQSSIDCRDNSRNKSSKLEEQNFVISDQEMRSLDIRVAEPDTRFCLICKERFQNYFNHINSFTHKKNQKVEKSGPLKFKEQPQISIEICLKQLIKSVDKEPISRKALIRTKKREGRKNVQRVTQRMNEEEEEQPINSTRKMRILSSGEQLGIKSFQSTELINERNMPRKGSFFDN